MRAINEKLIFRCIDCEKEYEKEFNNELIERFANTINFVINLLCYYEKVFTHRNIWMDGINLMKR